YMGDRDDAAEVPRQAFLDILGATDGYSPSATFTTHLYCVIANLCLDRTRKWSRERRQVCPSGTRAPGSHRGRNCANLVKNRINPGDT
ncbi:MAG: sigma factor, partial [Planctomycetota bacterium]